MATRLTPPGAVQHHDLAPLTDIDLLQIRATVTGSESSNGRGREVVADFAWAPGEMIEKTDDHAADVEKARKVIEVQGKVSALLEDLLNPSSAENGSTGR